jgi:hypothetical protein
MASLIDIITRITRFSPMMGSWCKRRNDNGTSWEGPAEVQLPPGKYRVVARANGYGTVTVPVTVAAKQTTTVHLEGGTPIEREKTHLQTHSRAVNTETAQPPGS